jgi:ABC-type taurine transport system ATPase subunit
LAKLEVRDISKHFKVIGNSSPKTSPGAHSSHSSEVHSGLSSTTSLSGDGSPNGMMAAVENVTLNIEEGQFVCFVGPSGCGKTTLLNIIAGLDKPTKGEVSQWSVNEPGPDRIMVFKITRYFHGLKSSTMQFGLKIAGVEKKDTKFCALLEMMLTKLPNIPTNFRRNDKGFPARAL